MTKVTKKHGLKANFVFNLISQFLTLLIPLITTPYLSRVLHEVGNGQISFCNSINSYFILFSNLGFAIYGQREVARNQDDKEKKSIVFWEMFIVRLISTAISLGVFFSFYYTVGFGEKYDFLLLLMSIQIVAVIFDIQFLYYGSEDFGSVALRSIFLKISGLICIFVFVRTENDVWVYVLCIALTTMLSNLIMWPTAFRYVKFVKIKSLKPWKHILPTIIIFIPTVITTLFTVFDKTMIGLLSSTPDYDNGCYEQAYKINSVAQIVVTLASSVMMPRNSHDYEMGNIDGMNQHVYLTSNYVWFVSLPLLAGFIVLSANFSDWFLGDGYTEVPLLLQIMAIRLVVSGFSVIFGDRFVVMKKELFWTIAVGVGAASNILINYLMIPTYGAIGAAVATAITEVMILVIMLVMTIIYKKEKISVKKIFFMSWKYIVAAGAMFGIMFLMQHFMHYSVWEFIVIGLVGAIAYLLVLLLLRDKFLFYLFGKIYGFLLRLHKKKNADNEVKETVAANTNEIQQDEIAKIDFTQENVKGEGEDYGPKNQNE